MEHLLLGLAFVFIFLSPLIYGHSTNEVKNLCSKTPYPKPCEFFLSSEPKYGIIDNDQDFLKALMNLTLDKAMQADENMKSLGPKCHNKREKAAWDDCLKLYEYTINRLKKSADLAKKYSHDDTQTWLSAALTDLETCQAGFIELGVTKNVMPLLNNNVSFLVANTLAMNHKGKKAKLPSYKGTFPTWVSPGDRKLLQGSSPGDNANIVVAQDGSGQYETVAAGVAAAKSKSGKGRFVIYVKAGTYKENVEISSKNIMLVGDGIGKTIITGSRSVGGGSTTFNSATVAVVGDGFICRGITFRNTAGAKNEQAVVLRSGSDLSVFYQCSFEGYQDTLYVLSNRQFYKDCDIYGTVDFIFGNAAVVFQNCNIRPRKPPNGTNAITAQGRTDPNQNTGIVIHNSRITPSEELKADQGSVDTYLGRPWKEYSRTVIIKTFMDGFIRPEGWLPWSGGFALKTLFYAEYANTGAGSSTVNRVGWPGYRVFTSASEASEFTVGNFIAGDSWLPATNVPFNTGL
ncbi:hypothetical protein DCAR_0414827 [Daucus carota subsp. sativus]|uniref:Pectinesterase n=1 Tax=Daucus carota subsp. sativus TaxID=79200 RepID=A0A165A1M7_DAUCS|nr:PREDICTED: pectinesterase 2-like [Daucus carota subsp. sativus]WOG95505.1 hypothetical protein DCAR_0414827 [Daucus carota subsp. sativus]